MPSYTKISDLTAGSALDGTEVVAAVQSSNTVKITGAQLATYIAGEAVSNTLKVDGSYVFSNGNEVDKSGSVASGATVTVTACAADTVEMTAAVVLSDTGTNVTVGIKSSSGSALNQSFRGQFADGGTNVIGGSFTFLTDGNTFYVNNLTGTVGTFSILSFRTGS